MVGLPANMIPPGSIKPAVNYVKNVAGEQVSAAAAPVINALETRAANKLIGKTAASYERGPQIDAAKEANRLGIALDPAIANPTMGNKMRELAIDPSAMHDKLSIDNRPRWANTAKAEMGLPKTTSLTSSKPFEQARAAAAGPYNNIRKIESLSPDQPLTYGEESLFKQIDNISEGGAIDEGTSGNAIRALKAKATDFLNSNPSGASVIDEISTLREKARKAYKSASATSNETDPADARLLIANTLENLIESHLNKPEELTAFRKARREMARSYTYEGVTDLTTGYVDPQKLKRMLNKGIPLSGDAKAMADIAGNYPEIASLTTPKRDILQRYSRSGALATAGAAIGSLIPGVGTLVGGATGAGAGIIGSKIAAKRMASPAYQAAHAVPEDFRPPVNALRPVEPNFNRNLPVIFNPENAVVEPGYTPNFTIPRQQGEVPFMAPPPQLAAPSASSMEASNAARKAYNIAAGKAAEERAIEQAGKATWMSPIEKKKPATSGGVAFELDPITGRLREVSQGMKGATPDTFQNYGTSLDSAAKKISAGKAFDLTSEERIAFNRTKVDLAEVEPGYAKLSDKQITERMMDRQWIADTIQKAREQAIAFEQIAARAESEQARFNAMAQRQRMMDLADSMEEKMRMGRPDTSRKTQGPKTREAKRNALAEDIEIKNKLAR
jgi:hypothetical protein